MATRPNIKPSDLPTKTVRGTDGKVVRMKVVQAESPTLPYDLLAAFRSNVKRIKANRRKQALVSADAQKVR